MMLSLDTAYRSFGGEVEALSTPTICRLPDSRRHQLSAIAPGCCARPMARCDSLIPWQLGNGASFAVSAQDPTVYSQSNLINLGAIAQNGFASIVGPTFIGGTYGANDFGGT